MKQPVYNHPLLSDSLKAEIAEICLTDNPYFDQTNIYHFLKEAVENYDHSLGNKPVFSRYMLDTVSGHLRFDPATKVIQKLYDLAVALKEEKKLPVYSMTEHYRLMKNMNEHLKEAAKILYNHTDEGTLHIDAIEPDEMFKLGVLFGKSFLLDQDTTIKYAQKVGLKGLTTNAK